MCVVMLHVTLFNLDEPSFIGPASLERLGTPAFATIQTLLIVFNGRSAVTLFFVLSGFVMSIGMNTSQQLTISTYMTFLVRRFFRLMPALWAAAIIGIVIKYNDIGHSPKDVLHYFMLTDLSFNEVTWTLVLEIAMCLIYPFMVFATARFDFGPQLAILVALIWLPPPALIYGRVHGDLPVLAFFLGLVVPTIGREMIRSLPTLVGTLLVPAALLGYMTPEVFMAPETSRWFSDPGRAFGYAQIVLQLSCFYLVAWLIYSEHRMVSSLLTRRVPTAIGRWSYSIYLLHNPIIVCWELFVLATDRHLGLSGMPLSRLFVGLAVVIPITILVAAASYRIIERPFINLGKLVASTVCEGEMWSDLAQRMLRLRSPIILNGRFGMIRLRR